MKGSNEIGEVGTLPAGTQSPEVETENEAEKREFPLADT